MDAPRTSYIGLLTLCAAFTGVYAAYALRASAPAQAVSTQIHPTPPTSPSPIPVGRPQAEVPSHTQESARKEPFGKNILLEEAGSIQETSSDFFWLNSGGRFAVQNGIAATLKGDLLAQDVWRLLYARTNPRDTDNGYHPQNIFRLVSFPKRLNALQTMYFKITKDNLSTSPNREAHNGVLFFNRYQEGGETLYYTGVRVDGNAIIKKKLNGTYITLASKKIFAGKYDRNIRPNLIPHDTWLGMRSRIETKQDGSVRISLFLDLSGKGIWEEVLGITDTGTTQGETMPEGYGGIRIDFMDVVFKGYTYQEVDI